MKHARGERLRERAGSGLRVVGAILLAAGAVLLYAERVVFDAGPFGARAALSLRDPRVAGYVAERIADEVIAQQRDLTAYRPLLVGAARAIVSSDAFGVGFRRAAQEAHRVLFSQGAAQVALSLPDVGVLVRSALAHDPAVLGRIPAELRAGIPIEAGSRAGHALLTLARLGHRFRHGAYLAIALGGLLLGLGIVLVRDRRAAVLRGGAALASAALVVFFVPLLARHALTFSLADEVQPVVAGIWDAFAGGLRVWALVLGGIGVVLAAAASSLASHVEVEEIARAAWTRLRRPAQSRRGEVARAAALMGVGLFAAFRPSAALEGVTLIAGALLAFEGLREFFRLVTPRIEAVARSAEDALDELRQQADGRDGLRSWLRHALVGLLALALIAGGIFFLLRSPAGSPETPVFTHACNGDGSLCARRLDQVVFAGAHNSMAAAEIAGWMFPNQELGSVSLLGHGIRALLFDVHYGVPIGDRIKTDIADEAAERAKFEQALGKEGVDAAMRIRDRLTGPPTGPRGVYLCHGFCELGAEPLLPMLRGVREFLVQNPGEVLVLVIEDYVTPADIAAAFQESGLERFVYRGPAAPPWPTLREMIDSDQRVLVLGENDTEGIPWYHPAFEVVQETPYKFLAPADFSCRANRGEPSSPLFQINHWIETTPTPKPSNAAIVNAHDFLLGRARQCQQERGRLPNILAVDFAMTGSVVGVAAALNGLDAPPPPDGVAAAN